jgi:predicted AAA+ superfamily ATPase
LGVSVPTISEWLNILEVTSQIIFVPPFYENFGKRLIKSPKLYFVDSGLVCHFLMIESEKRLRQSPFLGAIFEGFIASEILKQQVHSGRPKGLYYFRDQQGLEVDFLVPTGHRELILLEAIASRTVTPQMADSLHRLVGSIDDYHLKCFLVYDPGREGVATSALRPGVKAVSVREFFSSLSPSF